ncbi:ketopantoate hydroxymethyltransferase [Paenibacillus flagellatus]|uniref:Ketopantoate hydroxymethyltransferase n=1 Tax=Paenibacillus flagellatus TaxID=2211139 RepID=A0A2V5KDK3_9BACL|nr:ketopantoate hydroxymethyltransferase [Paenibacillus flagellatus]PYI57012.1 ketopantoate hydroxymethyltransferase [Paenibacillus flagellatus]
MIDAGYLAELTEYTDDKIAKVVLNGGAYEITTFQIKQTTGNVLLMEFLVPAGSVSEITLIELRSATGQLVSSNNVFVPITTDTVIKQTIKTMEV